MKPNKNTNTACSCGGNCFCKNKNSSDNSGCKCGDTCDCHNDKKDVNVK